MAGVELPETLTGLLRRRWLALPLILVCFGLVVLFFNVLPRELAPLEDRSEISMSVRGPEGATLPTWTASWTG